MRKRLFLLPLCFFFLLGSIIAETYRYCMIQQNGQERAFIVVLQTKEKLTEEQEKNLTGGGPLNTKEDRFVMEAGLKSVQSYYYMGALQPVFIDYTKNAEDPDYKFIDSWEELLKYIRWEK